MAGPVGFIARRQARHRWRALVALTVFVGLMGGLSLALIAGSRRSSTVVDRYLAAARKYDVELYLQKDATQSRPVLSRRRIQAIPGVLRADPSTYVGMASTRPGARGIEGINGLTADWRTSDPTNRVVQGRIPDGSDPFEVMVNDDFIKKFGRSVGDTVDVRMFGLGQFDAVQRGDYRPNGPRYRFRIAGVFRAPETISADEVHQVGSSGYGDTNAMLVSHRFYREHSAGFLDFGPDYQVKLKRGPAGRRRFADAVHALLPPGAPVVLGPTSAGVHRSSFSTPVDLETSVLLGLGLSLAAIGAIATALVLRAEQRLYDQDTPTLQGLGCTDAQLAFAGSCRALPVAIGGAALAVLVAFALSPRYPVGIGRQIELHPGLDANLAVLGIGALTMVALIIGLSFVLARPRQVREAPPTRRLTMARWLGRNGAPLDLTLGTQMAFERGRGVRSVPSRSAIAGGAAGLAIVAAIAIYVGGVSHLYDNAAARGWPWDAVIGNTNFELAKSTVRKSVQDPQIRRETESRSGGVKLDGANADVVAFDPRGDAPPEIISGRLPETASEIALGAGTMDDLGVDIGSTVTMSVANGEFEQDRAKPVPVKLRVVGKSLAASISGDSDLGYVSVVTLDAIAAAGGNARPQLLLVKLRDGKPAARLAALDRSYQEEVTSDTVPARVVNLHRIRRLPLIGLLLAGLLGTMLLLYTLAVSARARAHELAILRALGMASKRLRRVLAWQGAVLGAGIVVIGIPLGLVLGFGVWNTVAADLGVAHAVTVTPWIWLLAPLALLVAVGASIPPARRARRQPVATLLHVE